ncbi:PIN domain-containing protein [Iningainema tapete]
MRQQHRLKLPDAIIVATAVKYNATLVTSDSQLKNIPNVNIFDFA